MATTAKALSKRFRRQAHKQTRLLTAHKQTLSAIERVTGQNGLIAAQIAGLTVIADMLVEKVADLLGKPVTELHKEMTERAMKLAGKAHAGQEAAK